MSGLLLVVAHPDDEIFCSGLLYHLTSNDIPVNIICLTRGEGGRLGHPPIATRETIADVREAEMIRAASVLGVSSVKFLDCVDPEPDGSRLRAPDHNPDAIVASITEEINRSRPDALLTHGSTGDYGHPAHVLVHQLARRAAAETEIQFYTFNAFYPGSGRLGSLNRNDWATFIFDTTEYHVQRFESFWEHKTQWTVFVGEQENEAAFKQALTDYFSATTFESYCWQSKNSSDSDILRSWAGQKAMRPPDSGAVTRLRYKVIWTLRGIARTIKRAIIK